MLMIQLIRIFLKLILGAFGFHHRMVAWIIECVTSTSLSICINGRLHGYFKGKRGLCQGDPMSPYLFTLIMEVLALMLQRRVKIAILRVIPFEEGRLPVKYLGVPLVSSKLIYRDCRELIDKSRILIDVEQLMRGFLWCQGPMKRGRAKLATREEIIDERQIDNLNDNLKSVELYITFSRSVMQDSFRIRNRIQLNSLRLSSRSFILSFSLILLKR
ncbi:hypothetical protein Tco_1198566 [Tanacetum coccineum]